GVERQQLAHQGKGDPGFEQLVLVLDLVAAVLVDTALDEHAVAFLEVEQRPRGDRHDQGILLDCHGCILSRRAAATNTGSGARNGTRHLNCVHLQRHFPARPDTPVESTHSRRVPRCNTWNSRKYRTSCSPRSRKDSGTSWRGSSAACTRPISPTCSRA